MSKHTPGPWRVETDVNGCKTVYGNVTDGEGDIFTGTDLGYTHGMADEQEDVANARLICAAPDMLALLKELASCKRAGVGAALRLAAEAAIAKAEAP